MANVTPAQRAIFWLYCRNFGEDRIRAFMSIVTKGINSLRDSGMTKGKMEVVISEIKKKFGPLKLSDEKTVWKGNQKLILKTTQQYKELIELKESLGLNDDKYTSLCIHLIGRWDPLTAREAEIVIAEMKKIQRARAKLKIKNLCKSKGFHGAFK